MTNKTLDDHGPLYRPGEAVAGTHQCLNDLIGATTITVENSGYEYRPIATSVNDNRFVLFHQKEAGSALDTGPVWTITDQGSAG